MSKKRMISALLCAAILLPAVPAIGAAAETPSAFAAETQSAETGTIKATLRFDYPQRIGKVEEKNIKMMLLKNGEYSGEFLFNDNSVKDLPSSDVKVTVIKKDPAGGLIESGVSKDREIGYFDVEISGLPADKSNQYKLEFVGDGYTKFTTGEFVLDDYSKQVIVGTQKGTFAIGDVDGNSTINNKDFAAVTNALGKTDNESIKKFDFNGDGKIDIVDMTYVKHQLDASDSKEEVKDTTLISGNVVDTAELESAIGSMTVNGTITDIFTEHNTEAVELTKADDAPIEIPVTFKKEKEMTQIEIISPDNSGAITGGTALVEYVENGETKQEEFVFDANEPENVQPITLMEAATGETNATKTVVINLGKRVAVKKITIKVEKTVGEDGTPKYAAVQEIKFLKDILPENPVMQNAAVKGVKAVPGNESVNLSWNKYPNITGYIVRYGSSANDLTKELHVDTNTALVGGLKNLEPYYFTVAATSPGWESAQSETVMAIPQPTSVPKKPDMVTVSPMDGALSISWKKAENAVYYKVFYKEKNAENYIQFGDKLTETNTKIGGLVNDTEYYLYIIAGNDIGEGPRSDIAEGIPKKIIVEAPDIPTLNMLPNDNIESIVMQNPNNVKQDEYPNGFQVSNVADGDYGTHWTARAFWESNQFTFTFKEAKEMNYMVYVPRLDGNYRKSLARYSITVWDEEGNAKQLVSDKGIQINSGETGYMILPFEKSMVKKLAVSVAQWSGSPTGVSLAEAVFYESDNLESDVRALFANDIYTELSAEAKNDKEATIAKINKLRAQANDSEGYYVDKDVLLDELNLAESLLNGDTSALGRLKNGIESRSAGADSAKYKQSSSDLQPLGVVAYATDYAERNKFDETKVTIYANIPEGENVYLVATQYYAEANSWQGGGVALHNGRNIIDIPKMGSQTSERGGSLYLRYSGGNPEAVSLQIRQGATVIPMLELADWYRIDETERKSRIGAYVDELESHVAGLNKSNRGLQIANSTEISMPNVLLSIPADRALAGIMPTGASRDDMINKLYDNVLAWEDIMHVCNTTQGIDNTLENSDMQSRQNIRYMRMFGSAFMYAAGSHVGIGYGSAGGMVSGTPISKLAEGATANNIFGWGIAHEIGHNMDKLGKAEITNNIYSLMVQTFDGKQNTLNSRLENSNKYAKIYDKVALGYPGMSNDVFVQLGMYWQLHLAYDNGDNPFAFYNTLFKKWKASTVKSDEQFALIASEIAGKNLTEFFESWGMRLSDSAKETLKAYPAEERKIQYLNDNSRRLRLSGKQAADGVTTAEAVLDGENEKQVNLTFSNTAAEGSILGYEIIRNGKTIAFTTDNVYTDVIGSANNMAFQYTVQAIDVLGNKTGAVADAGQIRVSYASTISADQYDLKRDGTTLTFTLKEETVSSGIKVTNAPANGDYKVTVTNEAKTEDGEVTAPAKTTVAKTGNFAEGNQTPDAGYYTVYFNKPGAASEDSRIYAYDVKTVVVEGIPEGTTVELIDYAGDNIAFNDEAAIGRLKDDYVYGSGEGEVIKAGTLVVVGTYRGDPIYNTIQMKGEFAESTSETDDAEQAPVTREIAGYALMFAEIPEDMQVSDISDGIFIFVPDVQSESELQNKDASDCGGLSILPVRMKAEMYRLDDPTNAESKRLTSDTIWIDSPSDDGMPEIVLNSDN